MSDSFYNQFSVEKDLGIGAHLVRGAGANPPAELIIDGFVFVLSFVANQVKEGFVAVELPGGYKAGTDIAISCQWAPSTTNLGDVVWALDCQIIRADNSEILGGTPVTDSSINAAGGTAKELLFTSEAVLSGTGVVEEDLVIMRLYRNTDDINDDYPDAAYLANVVIHYEADRLGR